MKVLVTGAAGFLGSHLTSALRERGYQVLATDLRSAPGVEVLSVEDFPAVEAACRGVEVAFHVAARACLGGTRAQFERANVEGTRNLVEGCRRAGVRRLVYTSSASVVFAGHDLHEVDEGRPYPTRHLNHYCATKAQAERLALEAGAVALRPHLIWGPGEGKLLPALLELGRRGWLAQVGDGTNLIDTAHVRNVVQAHLLAAETPLAGRVFTITDGEPVRLWGWVAELLAGLGLPPLRRRLPYPLVYGLGWLAELLLGRGEPPLSRYLAAQLACTHTSSIRSARQELGYQPGVRRSEAMEELLRSLGRPQ